MDLDCKDTLLRVTEGVARRGYDKFSNSSWILPPYIHNKIVEQVRLEDVFSLISYGGKNGDAIELFPLKYEGREAFLFVPFWSPRPGGRVQFKVSILAANNTDKPVTFRFEEPENRGPNHRFWHAQLSYEPLSRAVSSGVSNNVPHYPWLPTKNPAIPLPICGGQIDLLLVMLISVFGYEETVMDEIEQCGFDSGLMMSVRKRISDLVALRSNGEE